MYDATRQKFQYLQSFIHEEESIHMRKISFRRLLTFVCIGLLLLSQSALCEATPAATPAAVQGWTVDNLSTRSGPSTEYRSTGTYKVKGQWVRILSYAYDVNDLCWLQCEVPYGSKLRRVYTGLKRFDASTVDLTTLMQEDPLAFVPVKVLYTSKALYGPGDGYGEYDSLTVDKNKTVQLISTEGDYALVEWKTMKQRYRAWVHLSTLDY